MGSEMCIRDRFIAKPIAQAYGFKFWKPIIWDKVRIGMGYHYRAQYECILFFEKGKRRLNNLGISDVIRVPRIHNGYPAEKPSKLLDILVHQSSKPGELVIDPFMGSGSVGVAAAHHGCSFWGNDISAKAAYVAEPRLRNEGLTLDVAKQHTQASKSKRRVSIQAANKNFKSSD